jgi:hypothetical protein
MAYICPRVCVCRHACMPLYIHVHVYEGMHVCLYIRILVVYIRVAFVDELAIFLDRIGLFGMVLIRNGGDYGYVHGLNEL